MASKALGEIATALGLGRRTSTGIAYGELDGFPAQLALVQRGRYIYLSSRSCDSTRKGAPRISDSGSTSRPHLDSGGPQGKLVTSEC